MGRRRKSGRLLHGILLLDKATGCSSNHALQRVKRIYDAQKAGHTGSLDPLATGSVPRLTDRAINFHVRNGHDVVVGSLESFPSRGRPASAFPLASVSPCLRLGARRCH